MDMIAIEGIGTFEPYHYRLIVARDQIDVQALGIPCRFMLEGYDGDSEPSAFHEAMRQFIAMGREVLADASKQVYVYYSVVMKSGLGDSPEIVFPEVNLANKAGPFDGYLSNADAFADPISEKTTYAG